MSWRDLDDGYTKTAPITPWQSTRSQDVVALRVHPTGQEFAIPPPGERLQIGSSPGCDIRLEQDPYVSAVHSTLERRGDGDVVIQDRKSKNGTLLNGSRIERATLHPGALITIGGTTLVAIGASKRERPTAFEQLRGHAPAFRAAVDTAIRAASSTCNVLIVGETGTGKEIVARAIHEASARSSGPFVALNCGAIPEQLIGSELFGHEKGAFTGAASKRDGLFLEADTGTLFLDELGELPREQQPHLLRVLETGLVRPLGSSQERRVDVRVLAATNRMEGLGSEASPVRSDLYHRLATVVIVLPPLRERRDDIPPLVHHFMEEFAETYGPRHISEDTICALQAYSWPGNIRELRGAVHRAMALSGGELTTDTLLAPISVLAGAADELAPSQCRPLSPRSARDTIAGPRIPASSHEGDAQISPFNAAMRDMLVDAYERCGSIRRAAAFLGIPKSTFADRARRLGVRFR
jgi:DNA-binding NtrC family response regulator